MTTQNLNEIIFRKSYAVNEVKVNERGVKWELRRKNEGGSLFFAIYSPIPDGFNIDFYFPSRHLPVEEIFNQFNKL